MRMIALAQAWQDDGGEVVFLYAEITPAIETRLYQEGFLLKKIQATPGSFNDLEATCSVIVHYQSRSTTVVLDGYQFDADFQIGLKKAGCRLLVLDDYGHSSFYHADWVLNQNISAREQLYSSRTPNTRLLLGTKFALLRREFLKHRGWQRQTPKAACKVLVTLGGADPDNVTGKLIEALSTLKIEAKVVVGGSNPHLQQLQQVADSIKPKSAKIDLIINPADMPGLMAWADLAVSAGGSTAWELAFMGLPSLFVILAENQKQIVEQLAAEEFGFSLGIGASLNSRELIESVCKVAKNSEYRKAISNHARNMVDGNGAARIVSELKNARIVA